MPGKAKKLPYDEGDEVWVKAKVTRIAPASAEGYTQVTVELPTRHRDTVWLRDGDDPELIRPA